MLIQSIGRNYHWEPKVYESLYLDDADFFGIYYWYEDVMEEEVEIEKIRRELKDNSGN